MRLMPCMPSGFFQSFISTVCLTLCARLAKDLQTVADLKVDQSCIGSQTNSFDGSLDERLFIYKGRLLGNMLVKFPWQAKTSSVSIAQIDLPQM